MTPAQLVIIGAGPGGYTAAFHAADLGLNVTLIDAEPRLGGVCLNRGCIPSKALLHAAKVIHDAADAKDIGIEFNSPAVQIDKLRSWKDRIITTMTGGLSQLAKARKVTFIQGQAKFLDPKTLEITKPDSTTETLAFEQAIIATGSRPAALSSIPRSSRVWDSTDALSLASIPASLLVIGGGYIGLELGTAYASLGSQVSVVEALPALLSSSDKDLAEIVMRRLKKTFAGIFCGTKMLKTEETADGISVTFQDGSGKEWAQTFAQVLVSVGRKPNIETLSLEKTAVKVSAHGFIEVDSQRRTAERHIFAIGDVTGQPLLAHKASFEAKVAADVAAGYGTGFKPKCIPSVIFTDPELAWCGLTEQQAAAHGTKIITSKFPWIASGRAMTLGRTDGMTKIIADAETGAVLGIGIAGVGAGELIAEAALAVESGMKAEDIELTIHAHPTLSETLMEAAEGLFGHPTHIYKPKNTA